MKAYKTLLVVVVVIIIISQALDQTWCFWDVSSPRQNCSMAFQGTFILEQQILCVYSGMACGLRTLGVRSPVLSKRGRYTGTWAGRVCLGAGPSSVGNLAVVFQERVAACSAPLQRASLPELKSPMKPLQSKTGFCPRHECVWTSASPAAGGADG